MVTGFQRAALACIAAGTLAMAVLAGFNPYSGAVRAPIWVGGVSTAVSDPQTDADSPTIASSLPLLVRAPRTSKRLDGMLQSVNFSLADVRSRALPVPRLYLESLPLDLAEVPENAKRKDLFLSAILPLVLRVNEEIRNDRRRLQSIIAAEAAGGEISAVDRLWLIVLSERYGIDKDALDALLARVDEVPVSLALAQAAKESGWGTSRFSKEGNALFGQWTFSSKTEGLVPKDREAGKTHRVRAFPDLLASVRSYFLNLNTHGAYRELRKQRRAMRAAGQPLDGRALAASLIRYSELGQVYVDRIQGLIDANKLQQFNAARLFPDGELDFETAGQPQS